jgi:hypothetical protein
MAHEQGRDLSSMALSEMDALWDQVKAGERPAAAPQKLSKDSHHQGAKTPRGESQGGRGGQGGKSGVRSQVSGVRSKT